MTSELTTTKDFNSMIPWTPEDVTTAWMRANNGMRSVLAFGALLVEIDSCLPRQTARNQHSESTLKAWLSGNCPEVNYMTAMGYKRLAAIAASSIGCSFSDLHNLPDPRDAANQELSADERHKVAIIDKYLTGATRRSIMNDWATQKPGALPGQKRKDAVKLTPEQAEAKMRELANHGMITARNTLVGIAAEKELSSRLDRTQARALIKDMKAAIQKIAEAIA